MLVVGFPAGPFETNCWVVAPDRGEQCVVDFKSGEAPSVKDVISGEAVQATHYALLTDHCTQVEYFVINRKKKQPAPVAGEELQQARDGVLQRLLEIFSTHTTNIAMPANGDEQTCARCDFSGLCRHGAWDE